MRQKITYFFYLVIFITGLNCKQKKVPQLTANDVVKVINQMTLVMVHDVTSSPLAMRFYAYACLSGYEVLYHNKLLTKNLANTVNAFPMVKKVSVIKDYDSKLSALLAIIQTAENLQPSGASLKGFEKALLDSCRQIGFSQNTIDSSAKYAGQISIQILAYARQDGYNKISNYKRYVPKDVPGSWLPTPPTYLSPVEPYFYTIRSLTLTKSNQFKPKPPAVFSTLKTSVFYRYLQHCHHFNADSLTEEQRNIANFWDCNPFAVQDNGHMMIGLKKISPGAHWMGITGIACKQQHIVFEKSVEIHTVVAVGLLDGFINCWYEKYRTNRIRPETAIHQYLDPKWQPLLQTPPFPEYLSGHAFISTTAAVILTSYFGDYFKYIDTVEIPYGISVRKFLSFKQAAREAGLSRLLGGIHFEDAILNGAIQGDSVGHWVLQKFGRK